MDARERKIVNEEKIDIALLERFAEVAHISWAGWMTYLFSKCLITESGEAIIPEWAVTRWQRQLNTSYDDLSEDEKRSDRVEALYYIRAIHAKEKEYGANPR